MSEKKTIRVVYVEPMKPARELELGTELEDMQRAVGGNIEPYYPFEEAVAIVCNDEGKINGMSPNRAIRDEDGEIIDVICGSFFICDCSGESFGSLTDEQLETYKKKYLTPERFFLVNDQIVAVPYTPRESVKADRGER